jgi:hypothetical protein
MRQSDNRPDSVWACPVLQALELKDPPPFLTIEGKRLELKVIAGVKRYELAANQRRQANEQTETRSRH